MSIKGDPFENGIGLKTVAVALTIGYWVLVFQSRADTIRQGGYPVDPVTGEPLGMAGTPINVGYAFGLFMVVFFPPIAAMYYLGVLQKRKYDAPETEKDEWRRIDNMYK